MVNPLSVIGKVINKASGVVNPPARINPMNKIRDNIIIKHTQPLKKNTSKLDSHVDVHDRVIHDDLGARIEGTVRVDSMTGKRIDPDSRHILSQDLAANPDSVWRNNIPNKKILDARREKIIKNERITDFDSFMKRPDTPEVKDIKKGPPSGKQLDYWAYGRMSGNTIKGGFNRVSNPFKTSNKIKILKGTMKEKIKSMKKYPGVYKKLKKTYPGLSDEQFIKKMDEVLSITPQVKSIKKESPFPDAPNIMTYWGSEPKIKGNNNALWSKNPFKQNRVKLSGKQQKKLRSQRNIKENEFSAKNIVADIFDGSFFMGKDKAEFKRLSG